MGGGRGVRRPGWVHCDYHRPSRLRDREVRLVAGVATPQSAAAASSLLLESSSYSRIGLATGPLRQLGVFPGARGRQTYTPSSSTNFCEKSFTTHLMPLRRHFVQFVSPGRNSQRILWRLHSAPVWGQSMQRCGEGDSTHMREPWRSWAPVLNLQNGLSANPSQPPSRSA